MSYGDMTYLLFLFSWSESATSTALDISEVVLLVSGFLLFFGAAGEYLFDHNKLPKSMAWPKLTFEIIVALSLCGELISDGGVAVFSRILQKMEGADIQALDLKASQARTKAEGAITKSDTALTQSGEAKTKADLAEDASDKAEHSASSARTLSKEIGKRSAGLASMMDKEREELRAEELSLTREQNRRAELEKAIAPREIPLQTFIDRTTNIDELRKFPRTKVAIRFIRDLEASRAAADIAFLLESAGWKILSVDSTVENLPDGVNGGAFVSPGKHVARTPDGPEDIGERLGLWQAAIALSHFLQDNDWHALSGPPGPAQSDTVLVSVGFKSARYFSPEQVALREEINKMMHKANAPKKVVVSEVFPNGEFSYTQPPIPKK